MAPDARHPVSDAGPHDGPPDPETPMEVPELLAWLESDACLTEVESVWMACAADHRLRHGKFPVGDRLADWMLGRLLEEVRALPPSEGRRRILSEWLREILGELRAEVAAGIVGRPMGRASVMVARRVAEEVRCLAPPTPSTPASLIEWLRSYAAEDDLYEMWARCAARQAVRGVWDPRRLSSREQVRALLMLRVFGVVAGLGSGHAAFRKSLLGWLVREGTADALHAAMRRADGRTGLARRKKLRALLDAVADHADSLRERASHPGPGSEG